MSASAYKESKPAQALEITAASGYKLVCNYTSIENMQYVGPLRKFRRID